MPQGGRRRCQTYNQDASLSHRHQRAARFRSSPEFAARSQCPDSEVRLNLQLAPVRTSESKDTGQTYDSSAALNPKFAIELAARLCELRVRGASSGLRNRRTLAAL